MKDGKNAYDVIVIGGGAAGMIAAGRAAERGKNVLLLEKNARLGEKLRITGGGRCNILNAEEDQKVLLGRYGTAEPFLYSAFSKHGMKDSYAFFESHGLPITVQGAKRAFPKTEKASDVVSVLENYLKTTGVTVRKSAAVSEIIAKNGAIEKIGVGGEYLTADAYILATGGVSHPETGSTGDGFSWLSKLGHSVAEPTPTIVPIKTKEKWVKQLAGISIKDMKITFYVNGVRRLQRAGSVLFTHFGLSGPLILNAAGAIGDLLHEGVVVARIDTYPDVDLGILDKKISKLFDDNKNKLLRNAFREIAPAGTSEVLLSLIPDVDPETKVHSVTKESRRRLAELLKAIPLTVTGLMGYDRAVVADGGLVMTDVDTKTMRSKRYSNLLVIGDLLHITRPSGGYSLQLCWTTGYVAGESV